MPDKPYEIRVQELYALFALRDYRDWWGDQIHE